MTQTRPIFQVTMGCDLLEHTTVQKTICTPTKWSKDQCQKEVCIKISSAGVSSCAHGEQLPSWEISIWVWWGKLELKSAWQWPSRKRIRNHCSSEKDFIYRNEIPICAYIPLSDKILLDLSFCVYGTSKCNCIEILKKYHFVPKARFNFEDFPNIHNIHNNTLIISQKNIQHVDTSGLRKLALKPCLSVMWENT